MIFRQISMNVSTCETRSTGAVGQEHHRLREMPSRHRIRCLPITEIWWATAAGCGLPGWTPAAGVCRGRWLHGEPSPAGPAGWWHRPAAMRGQPPRQCQMIACSSAAKVLHSVHFPKCSFGSRRTCHPHAQPATMAHHSRSPAARTPATAKAREGRVARGAGASAQGGRQWAG